MSTPLTDDEKTYLLELARAVITAEAKGDPGPTPETRTSVLAENRGAFVTLHLWGRLRGCIGYIEGIKPLVEAVADNALAAGFRDPRFGRINATELSDLHIQISSLTPLRPVDHWRDIEIPRHGVVLTSGVNKGVFLPQVAKEEGWDRDTMLSHLAMKADLDRDAWREGASFLVFEAEVFAEKTPA